jgi:RNA polymerase sigma factor for flagellar operon FliA
MKGQEMTQDNPLAHLELWQAYLEMGSQDARQRLVEQYLRVVRYVAGRMAVGLPHYVEYNDLVSAGLLGLIQAIDNFDHQRGIKFETYAIPRIRGAILDELRSQDWFPRSLRRKAKQVELAYATLEVRLGRPATDEEIARELGIPVGELDGLLSEVSLATIMSLDADPNGDDEQQSGMGDYLPDPRSDDVERSIAEQEMRELIAHRLAELPEKEQLVLVLYYYEELTLKEIGEILDVTESRVCQIHTKAILRLKGKIDRHEGKTSIGRLTSEIQQRRPSILDPLAVKVNIMAGLVLAPLASLASQLISGPPA